MVRQPPISPLFPCTTLFRSAGASSGPLNLNVAPSIKVSNLQLEPSPNTSLSSFPPSTPIALRVPAALGEIMRSTEPLSLHFLRRSKASCSDKSVIYYLIALHSKNDADIFARSLGWDISPLAN